MKKSTLFGVIYFALSFGLFLYGFCAWRAIQGTSLLSMGVTQGRIFVNTWGFCLFAGGVLLLFGVVIACLRMSALRRRRKRRRNSRRDVPPPAIPPIEL
ncbi:MAG: hypothetical protein HFJ86_10970 [Oscillospiraceae bacterium]|nr:hypothetical protein [Oscillospiraceae bacterium]